MMLAAFNKYVTCTSKFQTEYAKLDATFFEDYFCSIWIGSVLVLDRYNESELCFQLLRLN